MISIEYAQSIYGDPEAIKREYITEETVREAEALAQAAVEMETFGKLGYLGSIGDPYDWWCENCPLFDELSKKYEGPYRGGTIKGGTRKFSAIQAIANALTMNEKIDRVESRIKAIDALPLPLDDDLAAEAVHLRNWLRNNAPNF